jgi:hypothetical protein
MMMTTTTTPLAATTTPEWPVQLSRFSHTAGWQTLRIGGGKSSRQQINKRSKASKHTAKHIKTHGSHTCAARPVEGAIVLQALRLRIPLRHDTVVTRRQQCLRIQSKQGLRVLVLNFSSPTACRAFGDALLQLNAHLLPEPSASLVEDVLCSSADDQDAVSSYVTRLLYDPAFLALVATLEATLLAAGHDLGTPVG